MGYFSEQSIMEEEKIEDRSYSSFISQLLWRLDDLKNRYAELVELNAHCYGEDRYTDDDYRYAPANCFKTLFDVAFAIEIVKTYLNCECGIIIEEQNDNFENKNDSVIEIEQLNLFDEYYFNIVTMPQIAA